VPAEAAAVPAADIRSSPPKSRRASDKTMRSCRTTRSCRGDEDEAWTMRSGPGQAAVVSELHGRLERLWRDEFQARDQALREREEEMNEHVQALKSMQQSLQEQLRFTDALREDLVAKANLAVVRQPQPAAVVEPIMAPRSWTALSNLLNVPPAGNPTLRSPKWPPPAPGETTAAPTSSRRSPGRHAPSSGRGGGGGGGPHSLDDLDVPEEFATSHHKSAGSRDNPFMMSVSLDASSCLIPVPAGELELDQARMQEELQGQKHPPPMASAVGVPAEAAAVGAIVRPAAPASFDTVQTEDFQLPPRDPRVWPPQLSTADSRCESSAMVWPESSDIGACLYHVEASPVLWPRRRGACLGAQRPVRGSAAQSGSAASVGAGSGLRAKEAPWPFAMGSGDASQWQSGYREPNNFNLASADGSSDSRFGVRGYEAASSNAK